MSAVRFRADTCRRILQLAGKRKGRRYGAHNRENHSDNFAVLYRRDVFDFFQIRRAVVFCWFFVSRIYVGTNRKRPVCGCRVFGNRAVCRRVYPDVFSDDIAFERFDKSTFAVHFVFGKLREKHKLQRKFFDNNQVRFDCFHNKYPDFHALVSDFCKNIQACRVLRNKNLRIAYAIREVKYEKKNP